MALMAAVEEAERALAVAVSLAGRVAGSGASERRHGLPLDLLLAADAGLPGVDRHTLITAGQVLETMPVLAAAHRDGRVSWGQVRHVVAAVKRRSLGDRAVIDARIADTLADRDRCVDPDGLCEAVDAAVDELVSRRGVEDRDQRAAAANRLWAQQGFDGRVTGGFSYDPAAAAVVCNALAACQGRPAADDSYREPQIPTPQQRSAARSLVRICEQWLAGTPGGDDHDGEGGTGRRARPAYVVTVDGDRLDASQPGLLRLRLPGPSPRVSGRRMATDATAGADVRVVVTAGGAPQAVSGVVRTDAANLPLDEGWRHARALGIPAPSRQGSRRCSPRSPGGEPRRPGRPGAGWAPPAVRPRPARRHRDPHRHPASRWLPATGAAGSPAAAPRSTGATCTTSWPATTAVTTTPTASRCSADRTTAASTRTAGSSPSTRPPA